MRRFINMLLAAAVISVGCQVAWAADASKPNIIFFLADDYGLDGVGCYGSDQLKTPHIDALAASGMRFENGYATPLCGPTRCQFITGRYGFRTGGLTNQLASTPSYKEEPSIARILKRAGYATGHCGKWRQMSDLPGDWGFDEYITDPTASGWFWQKSYTTNGKLVELDEEVYYPDVTHQFALDFISRHRDEPFFFYYASHLVHGPILRTPDSKAGVTDRWALYVDNVAYLDKQLGELVAHLDRLGLREKTLIVFSADNGTTKQSLTIGRRAITGQKGSMLEGGAHVPLIANWKGVTPSGKVTKDLVDFTDMLVTFAELAGAKLPDGTVFDGHSFAAQLRGQPGTARPWVYVQLGNNYYVRNQGWKLTQSGQLFDMTDAPFVEKPVSGEAENAAAAKARQQLEAALGKLDPKSGKTAPSEGDKKIKKKRPRKTARRPAT